MNLIESKLLYERAKNVIPGGVNSPVRAFKSVGGTPVFIKSAKGAYLYDEEGNRYIDYINSWGPMIMGHAFEPVVEAIKKAVVDSTSYGAPTRKEVEMAELIIQMVPSIEMVRMVNSGTEATMAAIRLARGATGKDKIIKFEGCYHGHGDSFLIAAGSGAITMGVPDSLGVPQSIAQDTLTVPYNDITTVEAVIEQHHGNIAAIIVEPVVGNMGCVLPQPDFLPGLRKLCNKWGIILIFDEVMTGFRLAPGGAQQLFDVMPDITTLGKILGGGLPVGAYGGKKELMALVAPEGKVYQAGTLSGNPIAMAAGITLLQYLKNNPSVYQKIENTTHKLANGFKQNHQKLGVDFTVNHIGSMISIFFTSENVINLKTAQTSNVKLFAEYFHEMLKRGIYLAPSQFESLFINTCRQRTREQTKRSHKKQSSNRIILSP